MIASDAGLVHARKLVSAMVDNEAKARELANRQVSLHESKREIQEQTS